jgi:hypothetical protein
MVHVFTVGKIYRKAMFAISIPQTSRIGLISVTYGTNNFKLK